MDLILLEKIKELRCKNNGITKIARQLNKSTETIRKYLVYLGQKLTCKYCNNHFYDD